MRNILFLILIGCSFTLSGQSLNQKHKNPPAETKPAAGQKQPLSPASQHYFAKYAAASRWNDMSVARDALYDLIVENPSSDSLMFTLAYFYFQNQSYASTLLISQDLLARDAKNATYLELAAVSAQELGVHDKALQHFESLYLVSNNIATLYQIAFLQFNLKRYTECLASVNILLGKPEASTTNVVFNDPQGKQKEYPMKVAIINLKGLVALEQGDKVAARKSFNEALALAPDFVPAKDNLEKAK
jgi:tetratricopeptide (TPR) repeat protein